MKRQRPSGAQQRRAKREREMTLQAMAGSIHKYVRTSLPPSTEDAEEISVRVCTCEAGELGQREEYLQPSTSTVAEVEEPGKEFENIQANVTAHAEIRPTEHSDNVQASTTIGTPVQFKESSLPHVENCTCTNAGTQQPGNTSENMRTNIFTDTGVEPGEQSDDMQTHTLGDMQAELTKQQPRHTESNSPQSRKGPAAPSDTQADALLNHTETTDVLNEDVYSDIGAWPVIVPDDIKVSLVRRGSEPIRNKDGPFPAVKREAGKGKTFSSHLTKFWFYKTSADGSQVPRTWMVYSKSTNSIYCFCCKLFGEGKAPASSFITGFNSWWKLNPKVGEHESSESHMSCYEQWRTLDVNLKHDRTIDAALQREKEAERKRWRDILHRLLEVVLFLAKMNLPFRGHKEDIDSSNKGNFLELVEFLSNYDTTLKEHFTRVKTAIPADGRLTSYLSPQTQNEFIQLLGKHVKGEIATEIKEAKYFGILFDSTPDVSHVDQMCQVIRYVHIKDGEVTVKESFLGFFPIEGKTAAEITDRNLKQFEDDGLDIAFCRSQGYDNAAVMAGIHGGVQARIKQINSKALFVPCANHSLNLCGVHSFESVNACVAFFWNFGSYVHVFFMLTSKMETSERCWRGS
ncbi:unnamed protein product [Ixodes pacificus]